MSLLQKCIQHPKQRFEAALALGSQRTVLSKKSVAEPLLRDVEASLPLEVLGMSCVVCTCHPKDGSKSCMLYLLRAVTSGPAVHRCCTRHMI